MRKQMKISVELLDKKNMPLLDSIKKEVLDPTTQPEEGVLGVIATNLQTKTTPL